MKGLMVPDRGVMWDGHKPTGFYSVDAVIEQSYYWGVNTGDDRLVLASHVMKELVKMLEQKQTA